MCLPNNFPGISKLSSNVLLSVTFANTIHNSLSSISNAKSNNTNSSSGSNDKSMQTEISTLFTVMSTLETMVQTIQNQLLQIEQDRIADQAHQEERHKEIRQRDAKITTVLTGLINYLNFPHHTHTHTHTHTHQPHHPFIKHSYSYHRP